MKKTLNFDAFIQEKNKEQVMVTVLGKQYAVPCEIPAIVPVMMARSEENPDSNFATRMVMKAADAMFGQKAVDEMCASGLSANELATLVQQLFASINGTDETESLSEEYTDEDSRRTVGRDESTKK